MPDDCCVSVCLTKLEEVAVIDFLRMESSQSIAILVDTSGAN